MHKVPMGTRRYCTGINRVDNTITTWMVTLSIPVDMNMPMNLMDVGITDVHTVSPEIEKHFTFKEKNIQQHYIKKPSRNKHSCKTWVLSCTPYGPVIM